MGNRLYVGNLSFHTGSDAVRDAFSPGRRGAFGGGLGGGGKRARW